MIPLDYFKLFWDDDVMTMIVGQTTLYNVQTTWNSIRINIRKWSNL